MLTFQDQYTLAQEISGLSDSTATTKFKRDINQGGTMFSTRLGRPYNRQQRDSNLVADQQYYQLAEDMFRITEITANNGTQDIPLVQVADERSWLLLNQTGQSGTPSHFFVRGFDEVGLYPKPSRAVTSGLTIIFEPKHNHLTKDDFTTGTVGVTLNSTTITHSAAGFTTAMVGRYFTVSDGTDGKWYKITGYLTTSTMTIENVYQGITNATVANGSWRIGEVMNVPEEFQEAPVDYAMYRHYLTRGNDARAAEFKGLFKEALDTAQNTYGQSTSSNVIWASGAGVSPYNFIRDTPPTIQ